MEIEQQTINEYCLKVERYETAIRASMLKDVSRHAGYPVRINSEGGWYSSLYILGIQTELMRYLAEGEDSKLERADEADKGVRHRIQSRNPDEWWIRRKHVLMYQEGSKYAKNALGPRPPRRQILALYAAMRTVAEEVKLGATKGREGEPEIYLWLN